jgi:tetratricopeptide (TPR) repeat protein
MARSTRLLELVVAGAMLAAAQPAVAAEPDALAQGIAFFENFDDAHATQAFRKLLDEKPPRSVAAKAHLYLGLLAFNANSPDAADEEFKLALHANPAVELPRGSSPKAEALWLEARREFDQELRARPTVPSEPAPAPAPSAPAPPTAPAAATTAPRAEPARSHALGWSLFAASGVAVGFAIYGAVRVAQVEGAIGQLTPGASAATYQSNLGTALGRANAQNWQAAAIVLGGVAVAAAVTGVLTW